MFLEFHINYKTVFGEELVLNMLDKDAHSEKVAETYRMSTTDGYHWSYVMNVEDGSGLRQLDYHYAVECDGKLKRNEWLTEPHHIELSAGRAHNYVICDQWIDMPFDTYLYSSAFTQCVNRRELHLPPISNYDKTLKLTVRAPQLHSGCRLHVVGDARVLGCWQLTTAVPMSEQQNNEWTVDLDAADIVGRGVKLKFVAIDTRNGQEALWETGLNRELDIPDMKEGDVVSIYLEQAFFPICNTRVAGMLVPVFSLRSKDSFGVGDFGDLKKMIDFVATTHQRVLQVLPINDTTTTHTWTDSYPYSCISIFAIHPQYVNLNALPLLKDKEKKRRFERLRKELNALPQIDYERVNKAKLDYFKEVYKQEGASMLSQKSFKEFMEKEGHWLVPYAQYCLLRDTNGTADFNKWKGHEVWHEADRKKLSTPGTAEWRKVEFFYFVQYVLNMQMVEAHEWARRKGVILKGDIPIGVSRMGCDVWMEPKYFNLTGQAGAPPDDFSEEGQNWGFPTYNWDEMLKDDCRWWVKRFQNMSKFFDAYRIDHVLGFFRIWEIPIDSVQGLLGQFSPVLGMTREEIESYGLRFQEEHFTEPFISDWILDRLFHEYADEVRTTYLQHVHHDIYRLRTEFDTQRKIEACFENRNTDKDILLRNGLYALVNNVLFVRDRKDAGKFHPRISAQLSFVYEALYDSDKELFNSLYNDYYYHRNNDFWYNEAMKKLPKLVQATRMLVCAEDLGMVPDCVAWVMDELRILSLELESMPKDANVRFGKLSVNPYRSVCTISSHDMPTLRQWWDEDYSRAQNYYNSVLQRPGEAPHPLPAWLAKDIIVRNLESPSMLCVLSIQDWLAIDENLRLQDPNAERINVPANPKHYWRYRMHLNLEELMDNACFKDNVSELIEHSGRR